MAWMFVVMITFSCVMFIHMELVDALLKVLDMEDKDIPIITCPKCLSFQCVFWFLLLTGHNVIVCIATAFLASYCAIWFDLFLGLMDIWYEHIYKRISEESGLLHSDNRQPESEDGSLPSMRSEVNSK